MQFSKVMNTSVIVFAITMSSVFTANAQFSCKIEGVVKQEGKPLTGAIVSLVSNSETLKEVVTGSTGTYSLNLEPNEEYSVYITKAGFIKAELVFSTLGLTEEDAQIFKTRN